MPSLPLDYLTSQVSIPSELRTAEWDRVPLWIRERSFFMAGVDDAEILAAFRAEAEAIAAGESSESESRLRLRDFLEARGYQPEPGQEGTIKDLRTPDRMNVALRTNVEQARGWARWQAQNSPGVIAAFPAQQYFRGRFSEVPRDWPTRWNAALAATSSAGATTAGAGDEESMAALLNHPLWADAEFNRFGTPHPPYDFNSGMTTSAVGRRRAMELGLLPAPGAEGEEADFLREIMAPHHRAMSDGLEVRPAVDPQGLRDALADRLGGFGEWGGPDGRTLIFTDPNGTRPGEPEAIATTISTPLPMDPESGEPFPQMQADALDEFAEGPDTFARRTDRDVWHDFARLVSRVIPDARARRRWLSRLVSESADPRPPGWLGETVREIIGSASWGAALETGSRVARYAALLRALREVVR